MKRARPGLARWVGVCTFTACVALSQEALADGLADTCVAHAESGQRLRDDGRLREARDQLRRCSGDSCHPVVREDCLRWLEEVEQALPSIVLAVRDRSGHDVHVFALQIDGVDEPVVVGRAVALDPGVHQVRVTAEGYLPGRVSITTREGETRRRIDVVLDPLGRGSPLDPVPRRSSSSIPTVSLGLFGAGALSLAASAYLFFSARAELDQLRQSCAGACDASVVDGARAKGVGATIGLIAGGLAVAGGSLLLGLTPSSSSQEQEAR
jgi:hypothetical protein